MAASGGVAVAAIGSCVDLKRCIQDTVYLPVPRFSIKSVATALRFNWRQQGFGAYEALLCYWDSIDTGTALWPKRPSATTRTTAWPCGTWTRSLPGEGKGPMFRYSQPAVGLRPPSPGGSVTPPSLLARAKRLGIA